MTILSLISSEGYYGAENMLVELARNLSHLGCHCVVTVFRDPRSPHTEVGQHAQRQGLTVEIVPCNRKWDWSAVAQIRKLLVKHNANILHAHGYKADLYAYAAAWQDRVALIATSHNWPSKLLRMRAYAALDRLVLRRFDRVIAVSDVVADTLRRWGVAPGKVSTIFNGVDTNRFHGAAATLLNEVAPGHSVVGFVGRLVEEKGGALLLRAARQVLAICPNTTFILVGEGPARKRWEAIAAQLGICEHVAFAGVRDDMPGVYASFDMVVLPSLIESTPICVLEAMAAGKPVIATRVGSVPKLVIPDVTGLLLEPGDVTGLAVAILRLVGNPQLVRRLGENGCTHVAHHFSAKDMTQSYIEEYQQVLARHRNRIQHQAAWQAS